MPIKRNFFRLGDELSSGEIGDILKEAFDTKGEKGKKKTCKRYLYLKQKLSKESIMRKKEQGGSLAGSVVKSLVSLCSRDEFKNAFCTNRESCVLIRVLSISVANKSSEIVQLLKSLTQSSVLSKELEATLKSLNRVHEVDLRQEESQCETLSAVVDRLLTKDVDHVIFNKFLELLKNSEYNKLDEGKIVELAVRVYTTHRSLFESFLQVLCHNSKTQHGNRACVDILVHTMRKLGSGNSAGIIMDWLCLMDPEILQLNPVLLREFLFTESSGVSSNESNSENSSVAYLSSVMTHETKNTTLQDCVQWMFSTTKHLDRLHNYNL